MTSEPTSAAEGPLGAARVLVAEALAFAWFEKIALLLLAAHLDSNGWQVRLSVPAHSLTHEGTTTGTDWARAFKAVRPRPYAFGKGEGNLRRAAYDETSVDHDERRGLAADLTAFLRLAVALDKEYRYDGIWHDDGGWIDLVAWTGSSRLLVEAKGITRRKDSINWKQARCDTLDVVDRVVGRAEWPAARRGLLLPDDRIAAPEGGGFVSTLLRVWPRERAEDDTSPIYLIDKDGAITEWTIAGLR